jgi:hypothetical protein
MDDSVLSELRAAVHGLLYLSEGDEPFEVFSWDRSATGLTPDFVRHEGGHDAAACVKEMPVDKFFSELTEVHDGTTEEAADIAKYRILRQAVERLLSDVRVFRVGEVRVAIYVIGRSPDGRWCGVRTFATET